MYVIQDSIVIGYFCAAVGGVITLAMIYDHIRMRQWTFLPLICGLLLLIHPAWTVSAVHGDCGYSKRHASNLFSVIYVGLLMYQILFARRYTSNKLVQSAATRRG